MGYPMTPLTPQTPLTPLTPTNTTSNVPQWGNESGYDTASSFYGSNSENMDANLMSPNYSPNFHSYPQQSEYPQMTQIPQIPNQQCYSYPTNEPNSEEDELLDVIAKWQDN